MAGKMAKRELNGPGNVNSQNQKRNHGGGGIKSMRECSVKYAKGATGKY